MIIVRLCDRVPTHGVASRHVVEVPVSGERPASSEPVTRRDLQQTEARLDAKIDGVEARLDAKIDAVARQVAWLTEETSTLRTDVTALHTEVTALRTEVTALREDVSRDIARHMEAGFEMMRQIFATQDDRARSIEDRHLVLHRDFTTHAQDYVLHNKP